jgi:hypothetical protein
VRGEFLEDLQFCLVDAAVLLLRDGDDLADQFLLEVVEIVSLGDSGRGAPSCNFVLDGVGRALQPFDLHLSSHICNMIMLQIYDQS